MTTSHTALTTLRNRLPYALALAALTLATPFAQAQSYAPPPTAPSGKPLAFTIVSIKRHGNAPDGGKEGCFADGCHFVDRPLLALIMTAYNLSQKPIVGEPLPGDSDLFDLDAKIDPADLPATPLNYLQLAEMLQPVLADRFQLRVHHEMRIQPVYNIVFAKDGLKMRKAAPPALPTPGNSEPTNGAPLGGCYHASVGNGLRVMHDCDMNDIRRILEGLTGRYDFELHWTPDDTPADSPLGGGPSIFTAVEEQLGLKLESAKAPVEVLVIDSARLPTPN